jgi:hypothetical protein
VHREHRGLPAAATVEQAIVLAHLMILRKLQAGRSPSQSAFVVTPRRPARLAHFRRDSTRPHLTLRSSYGHTHKPLLTAVDGTVTVMNSGWVAEKVAARCWRLTGQ